MSSVENRFSGLFRTLFPLNSEATIIPPCADDMQTNCYDVPEPYHNLSSRNWNSTGKVLMVCLFFHAAAISLSVLWELAVYTYIRFSGKRSWIVPHQEYTLKHKIFDIAELVCGFAVCVVFVIRTYENEPPHELRPIGRLEVIDFVGNSIFALRYLNDWFESANKLAYAVSLDAHLSILSVVSAFSTPIMLETWLPFTFVRAMAIPSAARRLSKITDLSELYEEIAMASFEFFSLVYTFACTVYIVETLGNPAGWFDSDEQHLSFLRSLWFVVVTVSTVGYGDFSPSSILGRLVGMVLILVGVLFFGSKTGQIVALLESTRNGAGRFSSRRKSHVVVAGNVSEASVRDFCSEFFHPDHFGHFNTEFSVCLMTRSLLAIQQLFDNNIAPLGRLQALAGTVLSRADCQRAKMDASSACFILTDSKTLTSSEDTDRGTLMRALAVRKAARSSNKISILMLLTQPKSLQMQEAAPNFKGLCVPALMESLMAKWIVCPGIVPLINNLITSVDHNIAKQVQANQIGRESWFGKYLSGAAHEIYSVELFDEFREYTFGDVARAMYQDQAILFAVASTRKKGKEHHKLGDFTSGQFRSHHRSNAVSMDQVLLFPGYDFRFTPDMEELFVISRNEPSYSWTKDVVSILKTSSRGQSSSFAPAYKQTGHKTNSVAPDNHDQSASRDVLITGSQMHGLHVFASHFGAPDENSVNAASTAAHDGNKGTAANSGGRAKMQPLVGNEQPIGPSEAARKMLPLPPLAHKPKKENHAKARAVTSPIEIQPSESTSPPRNFRTLSSVSTKSVALPSNQARSVAMTETGQKPPRMIRNPCSDDEDNMMVDLSDHVIVLGMPNDVEEFLRPLDLEAKRTGVKRSQVLFVNDVEPSATQWSNLKKDSDVYFISSSPLNPVSIEMANVPMCSCVVMFADTSIGEDSMEPGMIDSGVVFAYRYLTSKHPTKAVKCLMEIVEDVNIDYLKDSTADGMRVYTQELFAQGAIYSRSIPTTLLVQAFYNEHILSVVAALLSSTRDYIAYNGASSALPSHQGAVVAQVPLAPEDCGRTFGGMYESLLRRGSLCLALFRCCDEASGLDDGKRYILTNPPASTMLLSTDQVIVLTAQHPGPR